MYPSCIPLPFLMKVETIKWFIFIFCINLSKTCYINIRENFMKNEVVHARVQSNVKVESEKVLSAIGITLSQAIDLFLRQVILKKGYLLN